MRRFALPVIAVLLVGAVLGVQVAAGGGDYVPRQSANPCVRRPIPPIQPHLEALAGEIVLIGLDSTACRLNISRERLALALADPRSRDPHEAAALKAGLLDAVDRLAREGRLPKVSRLLPDALDAAGLPSITRAILGAIPARLVDDALPTSTLLRRTLDEHNVARLLRELNDPGRLNSAIRSAVLHAALGQILDRLHP
jgi:hypothetical protein